MSVIHLSTSYLGSIQYYSKLVGATACVMEQQEHYVKQTYRNRCQILAVNGVQTLTLPVDKGASLKCAVKDVRISSLGGWKHQHWNAIESAYNNSPFFEYYKDEFQQLYNTPFEFLIDLNEAFRELICDLLSLTLPVSRSTVYEKELPPTILDYRETIHPKRSFEADPLFQSTPYYQTFGLKHNFVPNLSIVDLIFNMGPESVLVLKECRLLV